MRLSKTVLGYLLALGAAIALANSFIFSKAALKQVNFVQFGFVWFSMGVVWNSIWMIIRKERIFRKDNPKIIISSFVVAFIEAVATALFYVAIQRMENPAIVSFIGSIGPVFVTILGVVFLHEKYNLWGNIGIVLTITGVFIISFNRAVNVSNVFVEGTEFVVLASFLFSIATIYARKMKYSINANLISFYRVLVLFFGFAIWILFTSGFENIPTKALYQMGIGSFLETFITIIFAYQALKYIEAAKTSLIISTKSIFVLISAYLFFDIFPPTYKVLGGVITIIGVFLLTSLKRKRI